VIVDPVMLMKLAPASVATAFTSKVFPKENKTKNTRRLLYDHIHELQKEIAISFVCFAHAVAHYKSNQQ